MSQKINCLIVDDEPLAQQVIETYIQKMPSLVLVGKCDNAMEAYEVLHNEKIDVMFLDIQMPVITGVEFLRTLQNPPAVIFTTAYPDFAMEGYDLNITDYNMSTNILQRCKLAVMKAVKHLTDRNVISIVSVDVNKISGTGVEIKVNWRNNSTGEINEFTF